MKIVLEKKSSPELQIILPNYYKIVNRIFAEKTDQETKTQLLLKN